MAITMVTRTTDAGLLKEMYPEPRLAELNNKTTPMTQRWKRSKRQYDEGNKFHFPVEFLLDEGGGATNEADDSPEPDTGGDETASYNFATHQHAVRISGAAASTHGSIVPLIQRRADKAVEAMMLDLEIAAVLPASGLRGNVTTAPSGEAAASTTVFYIDSFQYVRVGMKIDVTASNNDDSATGGRGTKITAMTRYLPSGKAKLTVSPALSGTPVTTDDVFRTNEFNKNDFGLQDIVSTSNPSKANYGNIDRTASGNEDWKSQEVDATKASLSAEILEDAYNRCTLLSAGKPTVVICHQWTCSDLINQAKNDKRFTGDTKRFEIWGMGVDFRGIDVIPWRYCPFDKAFMMSEDNLRIVCPTGYPEVRWVEDIWDAKGGRWMKVSGKWAFEGLLVAQRQLVSTAPNSHCLIKNLAFSPSGTV